MKVLRLDILADAGSRHADCESAISAWLNEVRDAKWKTPAEMKGRFPSASIIKGNRVVFNIKGGNYRLDVQINYFTQTVLVKRFGTHAEYSRWNF